MTVQKLQMCDAEAIASWRYAAEYAVYDIPADAAASAVRRLTDPANRFFGVYERGALIGFCSIGADGQVPGGAYDESATDVGFGMRPDLVGQRGGADFVRRIVEFVSSQVGGGPLRVTIASWNERAQRAARAAGFVAQSTFTTPDDRQFTIFTRGSGSTASEPPDKAFQQTRSRAAQA